MADPPARDPFDELVASVETITTELFDVVDTLRDLAREHGKLPPAPTLTLVREEER